MGSYAEFIESKSQVGCACGFEPVWMPDFLFDFQRHLVDWAVRQGRAAIFADTGLGKTPMQLAWAENIARKTSGRILIITPLAVAAQTEREAEKFGIEAKVSRDGAVSRLTITNWDRLHYFKNSDFVGAVLDESAAIKAFGGKRRKEIVRFFSKLPYRLLCSATPAPNDFIELGCQSECLGIMTQSEMLGFFFQETQNMRHCIFKNDDFWNRVKWWFKAHSEKPFWRWVASWARACKTSCGSRLRCFAVRLAAARIREARHRCSLHPARRTVPPARKVASRGSGGTAPDAASPVRANRRTVDPQ